MKGLALAIGALAVISLVGCGQGEMSPKQQQNLHDVMSKGLVPPGHQGAGQAKAHSGQPAPNQPSGG